jgi:alcohol dehydrogenase class IV
VPDDFTWIDGERLIRYASGAVAEAPELLASRGFDGYALLTTERALAQAPALGEGAAAVLTVPSGTVPEAAASVREPAQGHPLVALGGGRVIDSAKAIAGADDLACAAIATTLSAAEMTPFHRPPAGVEGYGFKRPSLVVADPDLMASQPAPQLAASAMNSLAHATEALYAPLANPVAEMAALRSAELTASGLDSAEPVRADLALAAILSGYAVAGAGLAIHHATCQTLVRMLGTPHAETNAVMLPHFVAFMAPRAPDQIARLGLALGAGGADPDGAAQRVAQLAARAGPTTLGELGVERSALPDVAAAVMQHPAARNEPSPPSQAELLELLERVL